MTYATTAQPAAEPLSLADLKAHLRVDGSDEDGLLEGLIRTARDHLERTTALCLINRTMRLYADGWPETGPLELTRGPVVSVSGVTAYAGDGSASAVSLAGHVLDGEARPARLWLAARPDAVRAVHGIEVDFIAGFGETANDVPDGLKRALMTHAALMYEFRAHVPLDMQPAAVPEGYDRLVAPYLIRRL